MKYSYVVLQLNELLNVDSILQQESNLNYNGFISMVKKDYFFNDSFIVKQFLLRKLADKWLFKFYRFGINWIQK